MSTVTFQKPTKYKVAISLDSKKYHERYRSKSLVGDEEILLVPAITDALRGVEEQPTPNEFEGMTESKCHKLII